ncbi:MerR family transcriptional regulator [Marinobacter sp.]|uniref:MerR family transcriptional regulator n=1 Tax=Marinobacter sp. TaxID=50741 RepID=UPI0035C73C4C
MKIGELAKRSGLAASRIRFYEKIGLLKTVKRSANGYRSYPPETLLVLELITNAQDAGFSLDELSGLLPSDWGQWEHGALLETLKTKIRDIEAMQERLAASKAKLLEVMAKVESKPDDMACADNARRVMSEMGLGELNKAPGTRDTDS